MAAILPIGCEARLVLDVEQRDQYGRLVAYVYLTDGRMVNALMARQGFAVLLVVPPNVQHVEKIRAAADSAKAERLGLWSVDAFACLPADYRAGLCGLVATEQAPVSGGTERDPSYPDVCIPPPPDLDCGDVPHRRFRASARFAPLRRRP